MSRRHLSYRRTLAMWIAVTVASAPAGWAQKKPGDKNPDGTAEEAKPWMKGVSDAAREQATALFQQGNALLNGSPAAAEAKYREALEHMGHPKIFYNLSLALVDQGRTIEAYRSILDALQHGAGPFADDPGLFEQAQRNKKMLERQLSTIEVQCDLEGAQVTLNGEPLFTGPGRQEVLKSPGPYQLSASKDGYIAATEAFTALGGERKSFTLAPTSMQTVAIVDLRCDEPGAEVALNGKSILRCPGTGQQVVTPGQEQRFTISRPTRITAEQVVTLTPGETRAITMQTSSPADYVTRTRFKTWQPWAVLGGGAAVTLLGATMYWRSGVNFDSYDQYLSANCASGAGCTEADVDAAAGGELSRARWQQGLATGSFIVGGAAIATGLVLIFINKTELVRREEAPAVSVTPVLAPGSAGVSARLSF